MPPIISCMLEMIDSASLTFFPANKTPIGLLSGPSSGI